MAELGELPTPLLLVMDFAPLRDAEAPDAGFYYAVGLEDPTAEWAGAAVYESLDGGTSFEELARVGNEATWGVAETALGDVGEASYWDRKNTVDVFVPRGELESVTEIEVLNGRNHALLGSEVIAFETATLIDYKTYRLSKLKRGLRNTESETGGHVAREVFVLLEEASLYFRKIDADEIGITRYLKAVPVGGAIADFDANETRLMGGTVRPFGPCHVTGTRDGSNNLSIAWVHRTRALSRFFDIEERRLCCEPDNYEIDILDAPGGNVLRTITVEDARTAQYTAADQTADGLTPGDPVDLEIYAISDLYARGKKTEATV